MPSFTIKNFGCRASQADGAALEAALSRKGLSHSSASPDLIILNTCTVTTAADDDLKQAVRRARRENPSARILVTGCYAQRAPEEVANLPGVTMVVGNSHKTAIPDLLDELRLGSDAVATPYHGTILVGDIFAQSEFLSSPVEEAGADRSRPNLKVQDGCNNRCSFCIIPTVRGRSRSAPADRVVEQVRTLAARYREVVLTGINLGRWGRENGGTLRLKDLLRRLLDETAVDRIRLSSVEPMDWSDELIELVATSPRIAKHVHAPLQSGSDTVLRRMHRKYRPRHYEDRIRKARASMPHAAIGADVMTGFPGETEVEFAETVAFVESLPFTYLHVFTYSERPGTPAAARPDPVPWPVRKERTRILRELGQRKNREFRQSQIGRTLSVVTIEDGSAALSDNYVKIELARPRPENTVADVVAGRLTESGLREAELLPVLP